MNIIARKTGFTIVELLIVIVVIGILAAIGINTYVGAQTKGENAKTVEAMKAYAKALHTYKADTGAFPIANNTYPCMGSYSSGTCARTSGATACSGVGATSANTAFDTLLRPYIGANKPEPSQQRMTCNGSQFAGGYYNSTDGVSHIFNFFLKGDVACPGVGGLRLSTRSQDTDATLCVYQLI